MLPLERERGAALLLVADCKGSAIAARVGVCNYVRDGFVNAHSGAKQGSRCKGCVHTELLVGRHLLTQCEPDAGDLFFLALKMPVITIFKYSK